MNSAEARQTVLREFVACFNHTKASPVGAYLPDYVKSGCQVAAEDLRLVALTATALRFRNASPSCLTDCILELQAKYAQFVPDDWGGHMEKGYRELGAIGFNVLEGAVLDIREINPTTIFLEWAEPKLNSLEWERLLLRAVVDFGRSCQAKQIRLQPEDRETRRQLVAGSAPTLRFADDRELDCPVLNLGVIA
jgi:hypothetical protein